MNGNPLSWEMSQCPRFWVSESGACTVGGLLWLAQFWVDRPRVDSPKSQAPLRCHTVRLPRLREKERDNFCFFAKGGFSRKVALRQKLRLCEALRARRRENSDFSQVVALLRKRKWLLENTARARAGLHEKSHFSQKWPGMSPFIQTVLKQTILPFEGLLV